MLVMHPRGGGKISYFRSSLTAGMMTTHRVCCVPEADINNSAYIYLDEFGKTLKRPGKPANLYAILCFTMTE